MGIAGPGIHLSIHLHMHVHPKSSICLAHADHAGVLTSCHEFHDQPQFVFHNKGGVVGYDVWVVAVTHEADLLLQWCHEKIHILYSRVLL